MDSNSTILWPLTSSRRGLDTFPLYPSVLFCAVVAVLCYYVSKQTKKRFTLINPASKLEFRERARSILSKAYYSHRQQPFTINGDSGPVTVLPPQFANDIKNDKRFSLAKFIHDLLMPDLPGLAGLGFDLGHMKRVIDSDLGKRLNHVTVPLHEETTAALSRVLTDNTEWHQVHLMPAVLHLVAQVSSRVFLGVDLCRNPDWLHITREYTICALRGAEEMKLWPAPLRYIAARYLNTTCRTASGLIDQARALLKPIIEERRAKQQREGADYKPPNDSLAWFDRTYRESEGEYDPAVSQLRLSVVAIHTTTDLLCQTLGNIIQHPEIIQPLRDEVLECLKNGGWHKNSLHNMKLLDSCLKESQRLKPLSLVSMRRVVLDDVKLSNGTVLPKGSVTSLCSERFWDSEAWPDRPTEWDGYRFYRQRMQDPPQEYPNTLVSTHANNYSFGHGEHACPGRFFAAIEVKLLLAHILIKYDFTLVEGKKPEDWHFGFALGTDPYFNVMMKRRKDEVDLDSFVETGKVTSTQE